jgi:hypothetical protein
MTLKYEIYSPSSILNPCCSKRSKVGGIEICSSFNINPKIISVEGWSIVVAKTSNCKLRWFLKFWVIVIKYDKVCKTADSVGNVKSDPNH